jgi:rod shape-determining protein MreC
MIAAHETPVVAVSKRTGQVLAVGVDARRMLVGTSADVVLMPGLQTIGRHPRPRPEVAQPKRQSTSSGLFVVLCAAMVVLSMVTQQSWAAGAVGAAKSPLAGIEGALAAVGAQVDRVTSVLGDVSSLRAENQRLRVADEQLRSQLLELSQSAKENAALRQALDLQRASAFHMVAAQVVGRGPDGFSRTLEVDRGTAEGVQPGMVVVTGAGLLGRVEEAGPHSSMVQTLSELRSPVAVVLVNANLQGTIQGGSDPLRINVPNPGGVALAKRDWVLTSDTGRSYPPGLVVGEVANVSHAPGSSIEIADLAWVNDPSRVSFVLVITDFTPS